MKIITLEDTEFEFVCENPKCGKFTKKILRIIHDSDRTHVCFDCLKKGIILTLNLEF